MIFNPNSTGPASQLADERRADLATRLPDVPRTLCPTEHAAHSRELAREAAATAAP